MYGLNEGTKIGPYLLESQLGAGGQGSVWRAHLETTPDVHIALKIIPVRGAPVTMVERVRREAEALVRLSKAHPSVVSCDGLVEDPTHGVLAVAMEMVLGADLSDAILDPRCDLKAREQILLHVARALAYLHSEGFVHRDVKPQNILVAKRFYEEPTDPSTVKLVDFGIATPKGNPKPLTEVGTVIGTPAYMPPERIDPMFWQPSAGSMPTEDVFAFGVVAYETFFGQHPAKVEDDGTLSIYAEKYRQVARTGEVWPDLPPNHPWTAALRGALALKRMERLPDGGAIASTLAPPPRAVPATQGDLVPFADPPPAGGPRTQVAPELALPVGAMTPFDAAPPVAAAGWATAVPAHTPSPVTPPPANPLAMPLHHAPAQQGNWAVPPPRQQSGGGAVKALIVVGALMAFGIPAVVLANRYRASDDSAPPPSLTSTAPTGSETTIAPIGTDSSMPPGITYPAGGATTTTVPPYVPPHATATATHYVPPTASTGKTPPTATATTTTIAPPPATTTGPIHIGPPPTTATTTKPPPPMLPPITPTGVVPPPLPLPPGVKGPIHIGHLTRSGLTRRAMFPTLRAASCSAPSAGSSR